MRKKKGHGGHEGGGHERWLVSYADFITLLFAFFVVLFSSAHVDQRKVGKLARTIQGAFLELSIAPPKGAQNPIMNAGQFPGEALQQLERLAQGPNERVELDKKGLGALLSALEQKLATEELAGKVRLKLEARGLTVSFAEAVLFASGSADLTRAGRPIVDKMGALLKGIRNAIRVEGHTDNRPIKTSRFPSNWELSTARATSVVSYLLTRQGYSPTRLSAAGYGEHRPTASNATLAGRGVNRRVDIVVLSPQAMASEPTR